MQVNYLVEINALDDWELTHPLSPIAYKLMRKLLYLANKERFPRSISVPNTTLIHMVNCSEDSLVRARNHLIQEGLIKYKGQKRMRPLYEIQYFSLRRGNDNPLTAGFGEINPHRADIPTGFPTGIPTGIPTGFPTDTYINKIKRNELWEEEQADDDWRDARAQGISADDRNMRGVMTFLEQMQNVCPGLFGNGEPMRQILCSGRFPTELIGEALGMTLERHRRYPLADGASYALQLLVDWTGRGILTAEQLRESRDQYWIEKG